MPDRFAGRRRHHGQLRAINNAGDGLQGPFVDSQLEAALGMVQLDVASLTAVTQG